MTTIRRSSPIERTGRVIQMEGMFDVPPSQVSAETWDVELPLHENPDWQIGLIVGPSGSGKTTIATEMFGGSMVREFDWPDNQAVLDGFPEKMGIREITGHLSAVGFGSPPAWLRPYRVLSNGEQFRATMARAMAEDAENDLIVVDEFTSVVDRQVAKVAAAAVGKAIRRSDRKLIAVTCHYDVEDWLLPDWVLETADGSFRWGKEGQRRPSLELEIVEADRSVWPLFRRHHYLSADLHPAAHAWCGLIDGEPVAFASYLHFPHPHTKNIKMAHRFVVLPDWQGLGLGKVMAEWVGQLLFESGQRFHFTTSHPGLSATMARSPRWKRLKRAKAIRTTSKNAALRKRTTNTRYLTTQSFEYWPGVA